MTPICFPKGCANCRLRDWCGDYCQSVGKEPLKGSLTREIMGIK